MNKNLKDLIRVLQAKGKVRKLPGTGAAEQAKLLQLVRLGGKRFPGEAEMEAIFAERRAPKAGQRALKWLGKGKGSSPTRRQADEVLFKKAGPAPERKLLQRLAAQEGRGADPWEAKPRTKREGTKRNEVGDWEKVAKRDFSDEWPGGVNPLVQRAADIRLSPEEVQDLLRGGGLKQLAKGGRESRTTAAMRLDAFFGAPKDVVPGAVKNQVLEALARSGSLDDVRMSWAKKQTPALVRYLEWSRGKNKVDLDRSEAELQRAGKVWSKDQPPSTDYTQRLRVLDPNRMEKMGTPREVQAAYEKKTTAWRSARKAPKKESPLIGPPTQDEVDPKLGSLYWQGRAWANKTKGFDASQMEEAAIRGSKAQVGRKAEEIDWQEREGDSAKEARKRSKEESGRADVEKRDRELEERGEGQYNPALHRYEKLSEQQKRELRLKMKDEEREVEQQDMRYALPARMLRARDEGLVSRKGSDRGGINSNLARLPGNWKGGEGKVRAARMGDPAGMESKREMLRREGERYKMQGRSNKNENPQEFDPGTPIIGELRRAAAKGDLRAREILEQTGLSQDGLDRGVKARTRQMGGVEAAAMMEPEEQELLRLLGLI